MDCRYVFLLFVHLPIANAVTLAKVLTFSKDAAPSSTEELLCIGGRNASRGMRFNPQTQECDPLDEAWFATQIQLPGYNYLKLRVLEETFTPTNNRLMRLNNFVVGATLVMNLNIGTLGQSSRVNIRFEKGALVAMLARVDFEKNKRDTIVFNSAVDDSGWGERKDVDSPFTTSDKDYMVIFEMTQTHLVMRVDGSVFHSFKHTTVFSNYAYFRVYEEGNKDIMLCKRIQLFYPM